MSRAAPRATAPPAPPASRWAEWLTVLTLLAMAGALLVIDVSLWRRAPRDVAQPFDLKNPMLDVRDHECVEIYSEATPHDAPCLSAAPGGLILRPTEGPASLAGYDGLRLKAPYLIARDRRATPGSGGCAGGKPLVGEDILFYPLNAFGIPDVHRVRVDSIEPVRSEFGGRERLVYLAVLEDAAGYTWKCYLTPDALLTGLVKVEMLTGKIQARSQVVTYRDIGECP